LLNLRRVRTYWIYLVFLFIAFALISSNVGKRRSWGPFEQLIVELTAPLQNFFSKTIGAVEGMWMKYFALLNVRQENEALKSEIDLLRMEAARYREMAAASKRLQDLLQFEDRIPWPVTEAQVIGRDPSGWFESVIIDKGKDSGLQMNMPVVDAEGVVGRLVSVSPNYSKVLLIIDQNSSVDCLVQRSREKGIVKGLTAGLCKLDYVVKAGDVTVGDRVVTSGMDRVFPKGLPVGEVVDVQDTAWEFFRNVKVKPMVDFSKLEEVLVIMKEDPLFDRKREKE
jgi:rod shape-determining protein MreC